MTTINFQSLASEEIKKAKIAWSETIENLILNKTIQFTGTKLGQRTNWLPYTATVKSIYFVAAYDPFNTDFMITDTNNNKYTIYGDKPITII